MMQITEDSKIVSDSYWTSLQLLRDYLGQFPYGEVMKFMKRERIFPIGASSYSEDMAKKYFYNYKESILLAFVKENNESEDHKIFKHVVVSCISSLNTDELSSEKIAENNFYSLLRSSVD